MLSQHDKQIVRELAKQYMDLVCTEKQARMRQRFCDTNDLKLVRPPLVLAEIPWYQMDMDGELTCVCEDEFARDTEFFFRKALCLREPALLDKTGELSPESFSCPLLGRAYGQLKDRYRQGMDVSLSVLTEFEGEEMSHLAGILQRQEGPVSEEALSDCIRTIRGEQVKKQVSSDEDLLALRNKLKERKGIK